MKKYTILTIIFVVIISTIFVFSCDLFGGETKRGLSAYEIAVEHGFKGSEQAWLDSLQNGPPGESAYEIAVRNGFVGSEADWIESLKPKYSEYGKETGSVLSATNEALLSSVVVTAYFGSTGSTGGGVLYGGTKSQGTAYVITNHHTLYNNGGISTNISITLYGSSASVAATYIGGSATYDIAVLKITNNATYRDSISKACTISSDLDPYVGQTAIAIGNPAAGGISSTAGIVSVDSENIVIKTVFDTNQTYRVMRLDASINRGNSGGGVFNLYGQLMGIVNAKTISEGVEGMGYALPIYQVLAVVNNIIRNCEGKPNQNVLRCLLGITLKAENSKAALAPNGFVKVTEDVIIAENVPQTSIVSGILQRNDMIVSITHKGALVPIDRLYRLTEYSLYFDQGDDLTIVYKRPNGFGVYGGEQSRTVNLKAAATTVV